MNFKTNRLKITHSKQHREDRLQKKKKPKHILRDLWDKKRYNCHGTRLHRRERASG